MNNCFKKSKKLQPQFQLIYLEINVDQKLTRGRIRPCFEGKEPSLISKYQLLVLSNAVAIGTAAVPELSFSTGTAAYCACAFSLANFGTLVSPDM